MDESGDLGMSRRSSMSMVVAAMCSTDSVCMKRILRRAGRRFGPSERRLSELKFNEASEDLRHFVLKGVCKSDVCISWVAVRKSRLLLASPADGESLISSMFSEAARMLSPSIPSRDVMIVVDRRRVKDKTRAEFDRSVACGMLSNHRGYFEPKIRVVHMDSQRSPGLQAVDFIAGAIFQMVEWNVSSYAEVISPRIVAGRILG
ncbi:MAG: DUF3800 domain-containing protein [Thermoplasmata archaeon]|nr:DUF3800 domain-containing protein [Thermoplasmata archaeon]